jgi:hypothetical protein
VNGARKSTTGVDRPRELEGLSASYRNPPVLSASSSRSGSAWSHLIGPTDCPSGGCRDFCVAVGCGGECTLASLIGGDHSPDLAFCNNGVHADFERR